METAVTTFLHQRQDFIEIAGSILVGMFIRRKTVGFSIFIQVSLILYRLTKHYYETHPEMRQKISLLKHKQKLDTLYNKHLKAYDQGLKESHETGAAG